MAFTRNTIRNLAKDSGVELPKEFEDALISEHISARDAFAEEKVKTELAKTSPESVNVKETEEYKALETSFNDYKNTIAEKEAREAKEKAYRTILADADLSDKGIEKAVKYAEWDKIELGEDGKIKGANNHIKSVKEEWAEYVTTTTTTGAKTSTPPANNGGTKLTKAEIYARDEHGRYKLSTAERQKALAENPELLN